MKTLKSLDNVDPVKKKCFFNVLSPPKGTTPEGQRLNKEIAQQLEDLNSQMQHAILVQEQSGVRRPANTFAGKMDQVHQWMNNPSSDPSRLGGCLIDMH